MKTMKQIWLATIQLIKQAALLPQTVANAVRQRGRQTVLNERKPNGLIAYAIRRSIADIDFVRLKRGA
jgi:hypothetical protein